MGAWLSHKGQEWCEEHNHYYTPEYKPLPLTTEEARELAKFNQKYMERKMKEIDNNPSYEKLLEWFGPIEGG